MYTSIRINTNSPISPIKNHLPFILLYLIEMRKEIRNKTEVLKLVLLKIIERGESNDRKRLQCNP